MTPVGFTAVIPASEWPQTHDLDSVATGIRVPNHRHVSNSNIPLSNEKENPLLLYPSQYKLLKHE